MHSRTIDWKADQKYRDIREKMRRRNYIMKKRVLAVMLAGGMVLGAQTGVWAASDTSDQKLSLIHI